MVESNERRLSRVDVRLTESEKKSLLRLARKKGCEGLTALLRLLARAKETIIKV